MDPQPTRHSVTQDLAAVGYRPRVLLLVAFACSAAAFVFASRTFRVPYYPHFEASLLAQPSPTSPSRSSASRS